MSAFPIHRVALLSLVVSPWCSSHGTGSRKVPQAVSSSARASSKDSVSTLHQRKTANRGTSATVARKAAGPRRLARNAVNGKANVRHRLVEAQYLERWHEARKVGRIFAQNRIHGSTDCHVLDWANSERGNLSESCRSD